MYDIPMGLTAAIETDSADLQYTYWKFGHFDSFSKSRQTDHVQYSFCILSGQLHCLMSHSYMK